MPLDKTHIPGDGFSDDALPLKDMPEQGRQPDFVVEGEVVLLLGSRSKSSGVQAFPRRDVCPQSGARDMETIMVGPRGVLYSYSTVHVSATRKTPYTIGYVDFPDGVRVLAPIELTETQLAELKCDASVEVRAEGERWYVSPLVEGVKA